MKMLMVGYDLNKSGQNYDKLIEALKSYGTYWHCLDSTWLIKTTKTCAQVCEELTTCIDSNDELLVAELAGAAAWYGFNEKESEWLQEQL